MTSPSRTMASWPGGADRRVGGLEAGGGRAAPGADVLVAVLEGEAARSTGRAGPAGPSVRRHQRVAGDEGRAELVAERLRRGRRPVVAGQHDDLVVLVVRLRGGGGRVGRPTVVVAGRGRSAWSPPWWPSSSAGPWHRRRRRWWSAPTVVVAASGRRRGAAGGLAGAVAPLRLAPAGLPWCRAPSLDGAVVAGAVAVGAVVAAPWWRAAAVVVSPAAVVAVPSATWWRCVVGGRGRGLAGAAAGRRTAAPAGSAARRWCPPARGPARGP